MVIPIQQRKEGVLEKAAELEAALKAAGIRVKTDATDKSPGFKFAEQEMRGIPVRVEIGPKDIEAGKCVLARRDTGEKLECALDELEAKIAELMETIHFVRDEFDMTVLLIEHDMKLVSGICEELTVLNFGQVLAQGKTSDVLNDPQVIKAYLGE